jgi:hypothetical protein
VTFLLWVGAFLKRVPPWAWAALAAACLLLYARSHWIGVGVDRCRAAQEAAEKKADAKAAVVAKRAHADAQKATARIAERTEDAADEVERQMDAVRVCPEPVQPDSVRDAGREAVERARRALQSG